MRERVRVFHPHSDEVMTKQADKDGCDINLILKNYTRTGVLPVSTARPYYGNFENGLNYHEAQNQILEAKADFEKLPSHVREHVDNDPGKFLDMVMDPNRSQELFDLGLTDPFVPAQAVATPPPTPSQRGSEPDPTPAEA